MPVDSDPLKVDERIPCPKLLDGVFLVLQTIVTQVAVTVVVIPLGAVRVASAVAHGNHYDTELGEPVGPGETLAPGDVVGLHLRTRIYIVADRIDLRGIEVIRLVHRSVQVCHPVGCLDLEPLGLFVL